MVEDEYQEAQSNEVLSTRSKDMKKEYKKNKKREGKAFFLIQQGVIQAILQEL